MTSNKRKDGSTALFIGVSRSGKSIPLKKASEQNKRCISIDPKGEMHTQLGFEKFEDKELFLNRLIEVGDGDAQLVFVTNSKKDFDFFCDAAFNFNRVKECAIAVEELALYTNSASAQGHWGRLINQGLAYGVLILATVQRGQEVDKTLMNNATFLHITKHNTLSDRLYIASKLDIDVDEIPVDALKFLQWTSDKGVVTKGVIAFDKTKKGNWKNGAPIFTCGGEVRQVLPNGQFKGVEYH